VIGVQVGEDHSFHVVRTDAESAELRTDFLLTFNAERHFPTHVRMQGLAGVEQMHPLARVDDDDAFRMIDDPRIRRQPSGPVRVGEHPEPSSHSASAPFDLRGLDPDRARSDCVDLHALTVTFRTMSG
jgi:hypothetical protein